MKKLIYMGMGLLLCLSAAVWTGCDKDKEKEPEQEREQAQAEMQILDMDGNALSELYLEWVFEGVFQLRNSGHVVVEWKIPTLSEEWIGFGKQSGELAPGASERIELTVDRSKLPSEENEAVVSIASTAGEMQLKVHVNIVIPEAVTALEAAMVYVDGGTFMMGATSEQGDDYDSDERPVHNVTLDGFYIGKYEVTQGQWKAVMGTALSDTIMENDWPLYGVGDDYPMYYVSWNDATAFCGKLSELTGKTYRLPTEAEWEYAARGGQQADGTKYAGSNGIDEVAWYGDKENEGTSHPVGQKSPNALGLYDMSGNVWEWCSDWYRKQYYSGSPTVNPLGPSGGDRMLPYRVFRGGGWNYYAKGCRVSNRSGGMSKFRDYILGFRVVCER